jgi:hypothetical protein
MGIVASAPPGVVACRHPCLYVAHPVSVDYVTSVAVLGLPACVEDPLPDWRSALVGRLPHYAASVNGCFRALGTAVVPRTALLAYAGRRAFGLLHARLLDKRLASRCRFRASGVEGASMARSSEGPIRRPERGGVNGSR